MVVLPSLPSPPPPLPPQRCVAAMAVGLQLRSRRHGRLHDMGRDLAIAARGGRLLRD